MSQVQSEMIFNLLKRNFRQSSEDDLKKLTAQAQKIKLQKRRSN